MITTGPWPRRRSRQATVLALAPGLTLVMLLGRLRRPRRRRGRDQAGLRAGQRGARGRPRSRRRPGGLRRGADPAAAPHQGPRPGLPGRAQPPRRGLPPAVRQPRARATRPPRPSRRPARRSTGSARGRRHEAQSSGRIGRPPGRAAAALVACGALAACGGSGPSGSADADPVQRPARADGRRTWSRAFEKQTGIQVAIRNDDEDVLADQIATEGPHSPADVFFTENTPPLKSLQDKGLLAKVRRRHAEPHPGQYNSPQGDWVGVSARVSVLVYNPSLISASQLPTQISQLADPQVQGQAGPRPAGDRLPADRHRLLTRLRQGRHAHAG